MKVFFETVRDGLVPCKLVAVTRSTHPILQGLIITLEVTKPHHGYLRGEPITTSPLHAFPPSHVRRTKYATYVRGYDWSQHIVA